MSTLEMVLRDAGLVLAVGLIAQPIADFLRLPRMLLLLAAGVVAGPEVLDLVDVPLDSLGAELVFTLGVSLILFHGGVGVALAVISRTAVGLGMLVLPGVGITAGVTALAIMPLFDVPFDVALMVGAVLAATDPAILIPLFERLGLRPKVAQTLIAESAFNDPTATVLSLTIASVVASGSVSFGGPVEEFVKALLIGAAIGVAAGIGLAFMVSSRVPLVWSESPAAAIIAVVLLAYFSSGEFGGSGYLAAFVMGLAVGNAHLFGIGRNEGHTAFLDSYTTQTADIVVLGVFVLLGINLPLGDLVDDLLPGLAVMAVFLLVARPLTVYLSLLPDRRGQWTRQEKVFLGWSRETGVVPAAIAALLVGRGVDGAHLAVTLVALAIVTTLLLQATTAGPLARRLGLLETVAEPAATSPAGR